MSKGTPDWASITPGYYSEILEQDDVENDTELVYQVTAGKILLVTSWWFFAKNNSGGVSVVSMSAYESDDTFIDDLIRIPMDNGTKELVSNQCPIPLKLSSQEKIKIISPDAGTIIYCGFTGYEK